MPNARLCDAAHIATVKNVPKCHAANGSTEGAGLNAATRIQAGLTGISLARLDPHFGDEIGFALEAAAQQRERAVRGDDHVWHRLRTGKARSSKGFRHAVLTSGGAIPWMRRTRTPSAIASMHHRPRTCRTSVGPHVGHAGLRIARVSASSLQAPREITFTDNTYLVQWEAPSARVMCASVALVNARTPMRIADSSMVNSGEWFVGPARSG
ncbi:hypothetical protein SAMN05518800_6848 [Variovorax sp. YR752]|nr:hypothetical protein SAMN05518800_6848 [Variovorax sp. YR752]